MQRDELYTDIGVGLSTLLVSTNRAMREPLECGTSDRTGSTFFMYIYICTNEKNRLGANGLKKYINHLVLTL